MKTICLIYGYSARNAGDLAITLGAIDVLKSLGCQVKLFSRYKYQQNDYIESERYLRERYGNDLEIFESPFFLDRSSNLFSSLVHYMSGAAVVFGLKSNKQFCQQLLDSDCVIFNGGNLFRCHSFIDYARLCAFMYPLKVAKSAHVPYMIFPQSASTINEMGQKILFPLLEGACKVFFREKESYDYMGELMPSGNFEQTIDLAFFINKDTLLSVKRKKMIAITLRFHTVGDIGYLPEKYIEDIFERMGNYVTALKCEYEFVVVVQTDKDYLKSQQFAAKHELRLIKSNDPMELLYIYRSVSLLIGMRLHSIILSLSVGTPCFGLFYKQWGLKNPGMMNYFGMPYTIMDEPSEAVSDVKAIRDLIANIDRNSIAIMEKVNREYKNMVAKFIPII